MDNHKGNVNTNNGDYYICGIKQEEEALLELLLLRYFLSGI
jgi:hypothetical protein